MIDRADIRPVGKFLKPHGINGEITILRDFDSLDFNDYSCVIVEIDGIFVPFFINSVRPKGAETDLVRIDGISDERHVARLSNKTVYVLCSEIPDDDNDEDEDRLYADDFIGYKVIIDGIGLFGKITGIDDSTANYLFIVETTDGKTLLIPVADEFVTEVKPDIKEISMCLPDGLLDIQQG